MRTLEEIDRDVMREVGRVCCDSSMAFDAEGQIRRLVREAHALGRSEMEAEVERLRAEAVRDSRVIAAGWTKREALEAEIATLRSEISRWREVVGQGMAERDELRAELARLRAESEERERALREALAAFVNAMEPWRAIRDVSEAMDRARAALRTPDKEGTP